MTNAELRDALIKLAKRMGVSVVEIDCMARMIAQADHDPLPPERCGDPFKFEQRSVFDDDDFACINAEVPKPDAQIDLLRARQEYESDVRNIAAIYDSGRVLSIADSWRLFLNGWDWVRFWSVRHPDPEARARYARALLELDAAAERIKEKADTRLEERGIAVLKPEEN